jgi:hypothetical protein
MCLADQSGKNVPIADLRQIQPLRYPILIIWLELVMNWDAIGAVGEILGAVAVLATLVYLAIQVRYTRDAWQRQNERDMLKGITQSSQLIVEQPEMAQILWKGQDNLDDLDDVEKLRFHQWHYLWITNIDQAIRDQKLGGFTDDEQLNISMEALATALRPEGGKSWWNASKWLFCEATQEQVELAIGQGTRTSKSVVIDLQ